jgi:hypothetical protein
MPLLLLLLLLLQSCQPCSPSCKYLQRIAVHESKPGRNKAVRHAQYASLSTTCSQHSSGINTPESCTTQ